MEGREKGGRGKEEGGDQAGLWSYGQGAADQVMAAAGRHKDLEVIWGFN